MKNSTPVDFVKKLFLNILTHDWQMQWKHQAIYET